MIGHGESAATRASGGRTGGTGTGTVAVMAARVLRYSGPAAWIMIEHAENVTVTRTRGCPGALVGACRRYCGTVPRRS